MKKIYSPIRVFVSSKTDKEYEDIRKQICSELEKYDFFDPYNFTDQYASSFNVVKSYLYQLRDSDVVIVLIDNKYGLGEGTEKEIEEAKSLNKKIIYIVCNDKSNPPISLKDNPFNVGERYKEIECFGDMVEATIKSLLSDLIAHYRFFDDTQYDENDTYKLRYGGGITKKDLIGATVIVDLLNSLEHFSYPLNNKNDHDNAIISIARTILGLDTLDKKLFKKLKDVYVDRATNKLKKIIEKRFDALELYLTGDYSGALSTLLQILPTLESIKKTVNRWVINDIYLDIRNISTYDYFDVKNIKVMEDAQKAIDSSDEKLQFPYFDRCRYYLYQSLVNNDFSSKTENPSSIKLGQKGDNDIYLYMAEAFLSALKYGSITLLLNFKKGYFDYKWTKYNSNYDNYQYLELIRLTSIDRNYQGIKKIIRVRKQNLPNFDKRQILMVFNSVFAAPEKNQEEIATILLAAVGPIFDDYQFELLFSKAYSLSLKFASHKSNISLNTYEPIFDAYANNINRVEIFVWPFIKQAMKNTNSYLFLYLPRVLSSIFYSKFSDKYLDEIVDIILQISKIERDISRYFGLIISIIQKNNSYYGKFSSALLENNNKSLSIIFMSIFDKIELCDYIDELLSSISVNSNCRRNGYSLGGASEFGKLLSILSTNQNFPNSLIEKISENLISSLKSKYILVDEKITIVQCLILTSKHYRSDNLMSFIYEMDGNYTSVINETQNTIGNIYNTSHLFFALLFLDAWINYEKEMAFRESLISIDENEADYYKISSFLSHTFVSFGSNHFSELTIFSIFQFAWKCYNSKNEETRHSGLMLLYELIKDERLNETILRGMRDTFIYRATDEKIGLLRCAKRQKKVDYYNAMLNYGLSNSDYEIKAFLLDDTKV